MVYRPNQGAARGGTFNATVSVVGSSYEARDADGDIITTGGTAATVIQAALDKTGRVLLRKGSYPITTTLFLDSDTDLEGEGKGTVLTDATGITIVRNRTLGGTQARLAIRNLRITGPNSYVAAAAGINLDSVDDAIIEGVYVEKCGEYGILINNGSTNVGISRCHAISNGGHGISLANVTDFTIRGCISKSNGLTGHAGAYGILVSTGCSQGIVAGNVCRLNGGAASGDGIQALGSTDITVTGNVASTNTRHGIAIDNTTEFTISSNQCNGNGTGGGQNGRGIIVLDTSTRGQVLGNTCKSNGSFGISMSTVNNVVISTNYVASNGSEGIALVVCHYCTVQGNHVRANTAHGITLNRSNYNTIVGNVCMNAPASNDGIFLYTTATVPTSNVIVGNVCTDDQGPATQRYGINLNSVNASNVVLNNQVSGNLTAGLNGAGATDIVASNKGYVTEANGSATILSGTTSITVTHGLARTPVAADIHVTPTENPTNDPGHIWVSGITSTQFVINCRADPGASNLDLSWNARVL